MKWHRRQWSGFAAVPEYVDPNALGSRYPASSEPPLSSTFVTPRDIYTDNATIMQRSVGVTIFGVVLTAAGLLWWSQRRR